MISDHVKFVLPATDHLPVAPMNAGYRAAGIWCLVICLLCLLPHYVVGQIPDGPPRIRNVYIPSDQLEVLFDDASRGVLMPREKLMALWREAQRHAQRQAGLPVEVVLTRAEYTAQPGEHCLQMTGRIHITKLRAGRQAIELPFGGLAIESARVDGQPAHLGRQDDHTLLLLLDEPGEIQLELEMSAPLAGKSGDLATTLRLPPVPASELEIQLDDGKRLQVGERVMQADSTGENRRTYRIPIDHTGLVPLVISDRTGGGDRVPLVLAASRVLARVEPAGLRWQVELDLEVYARASDTFQLELPGSLEVAEVEAPQLARWMMRAPGSGTQTIALEFHQPFLGRRQVSLLAFAPVPMATRWDVPTLKVLEAASHVGQVLVDCAPSLRIEANALQGIRPEQWPPDTVGREQIDSAALSMSEEDANSNSTTSPDSAATLDQSSASRADTPSHNPTWAHETALAFVFWDEDYRLQLQATPRHGSVQTSLATLVQVSRRGVALRSSMTLTPRHAPAFDVQIQLPAAWDVTSVERGGQSVAWDVVGTEESATDTVSDFQTVRFDLPQPLPPGASLEIALTAEQHPDNWLEQEEELSEIALPALRLSGADEVEGTILVQAPPEIELMVSDLSEDLWPVAANRSSHDGQHVAGTALQYRYQDDASIRGRLQCRAKSAKVSARTLAFVRLDHGKLDVHYQLDLQIGQGLVREFSFTLPATVGQKIQISPVDAEARVIEQRHTAWTDPESAGGPLNLWRVVLDRPVTGEVTLAVDFGQVFSTPLATEETLGPESASPDSALSTAPVTVPVLALRNVSRQSGIVALEAAEDQQIEYEPENLRDLDPADVYQPKVYVPSQRIVAAYQYQRLPYRLTISATRHRSESVLSGICEAADIVTVADRDGLMRHQARFWVRGPTLQHVPVTLPDQSDLWTVMLDGEPVEVRRQQDTYMVPLPPRRADAVTDVRELMLLYESRGPRLFADGLSGRLWPSQLQQNAPQIALTTLGATWHVYPPDGTELVAARGDFQPVTRLTRPTLASRLAEAIVDQSKIGQPWKIGGLVLAAIVVGVFSLINTQKGCATTLTQVLVAFTILGLLIALLLPATQSARESARRMSCSNNLKQIGLALHNYHDVYKAFPPAVIGPANVPRDRQFSWIVAILPFIEQQSLYDALRLDLPWDHPHNAAVLQMSMSVLFCPSNLSPPATQEGFAKTSYVAVTGADWTDGPGDLRGIIGWDKGLSMSDITDGVSNTIMVAEVNDGGPWFAGGTGTARRIDDWIDSRTWSNHGYGGNVVFADGSVQFLSASTDATTLRRLATARGRDPVSDREWDSDSEYVTTADPATVTGALSAGTTEEFRAADTPADADGTLSKQSPPSSDEPTARPAPRRGDRGSLSLRVVLETRGDQEMRMRCEGDPGEMVLELQDTTFARTSKWFLFTAILLIAWLGRGLAGPRRGIAIVAGLGIPIAVSGLIPLAWTPLLDGILLGTLGAGTLWILPLVIAKLKTSRVASHVGIIGLMLGSSLACLARADELEPAGQTPAQVTEDAGQPNLTLYIPYDAGQGTPWRNQRAFLPHDQYLRLWKQAHPDAPESLPPGVRATVSHAEYSGWLEDEVARFDGRLVVQHGDDQWVQVPLPLDQVALEKVDINGHPATLAGEQPAIYLEKPGLHVVDVRFSVPVSRLGATGQLTLSLRPVASGRLLFQLPAADLDVQVNGCSGGWRRQPSSPADDASVDAVGADSVASSEGELICIPLGSDGELSVRWQPRQTATRAGQLTSVDQALLVEVLDSGIHLRGKFRYQVQQGTLSEVLLRIPPELEVQDVQGVDVANWSIGSSHDDASSAEMRHLVIALKTAVTAGTDLHIHCFRREPEAAGTIDLRGLEPVGVVRETGRLAFGCSEPFEVRVEQTGGLEQINHAGLDFPQNAQEGSVLFAAYRYTTRPWDLRLRIARKQAWIELSARSAVAITSRHVTLQSLLKMRVNGIPVRTFRLRLPSLFRVSQVRVPAGADWFVDQDETSRRLQVELGQPVVGDVEVTVSGSVARDADQAECGIPGIALEDAKTLSGQLAIYVDDDLEAVLISDGNARSIDPARLERGLWAERGRPPHFAFQYESPPEDLRLRLSPAPSRVSGDAITVVSVREGGVTYLSMVSYEVRQAGRARFRIATPAWLGDDIEVRGDQVRQVYSAAAEQSRTWDVELQQPVRGTYRLYLMQTLPLSEDGTVAAAVVRPLDVERSRGHVVLENLTADEIAATETAGVEPIALAAVPDGLTDNLRRQAVAAYRVAREDAVLAWQRRVREQETGLVASINLADLTTVVHADGRYHARAAYNIRNFTLQFLELQLPAGSQVWSVSVSGQPVRPAQTYREGQPITLLPLQKTSAGDFSSKVIVIYSGHLGEPLGRWSRVRPPAPRILSDVPVSRTLWTLLLPSDYRVSLVEGEGNVEEVAAAYQQQERKLSFLDELRQMVQVASSKSKSAASFKARANLKDVGSALQIYSRQDAQVDTRNAADVQQQAQQIEAEIQRLETLAVDVRRADHDLEFYFQQPPAGPDTGQLDVERGGRAETPPETKVPEDSSAVLDAAPEQQSQALEHPEHQRGQLREQAAEQLEKLQTMQQGELEADEPVAPQTREPRAEPPSEEQKSVDAKAAAAADEQTAETVVMSEPERPEVATGAGVLSLDLDLALTGTAYHFRKLHGEPRLVVSARHENVSRLLLAILWAALCLAMAATAVWGLRRPDATAFVSRGWPWFAALVGLVWLFLLPAGVFGWFLLVTALCVLIARSRRIVAPHCVR